MKEPHVIGVIDIVVLAALLALLLLIATMGGCAHECGPDTPQLRDANGHPNFGSD